MCPSLLRFVANGIVVYILPSRVVVIGGAAPCFIAPHLRRLSTIGELSRFGRLLSVMAAVVGAVILCGNELRLVNVGAGKQF